MKLDLRPVILTCPDCPYQTNSWVLMTVHWRKAWRSPKRFGKHFKPRNQSKPGTEQ